MYSVNRQRWLLTKFFADFKERDYKVTSDKIHNPKHWLKPKLPQKKLKIARANVFWPLFCHFLTKLGAVQPPKFDGKSCFFCGLFYYFAEFFGIWQQCHPPKMDVLPNTVFQIILAAKWLVRHSSSIRPPTSSDDLCLLFWIYPASMDHAYKRKSTDCFLQRKINRRYSTSFTKKSRSFRPRLYCTMCT